MLKSASAYINRIISMAFFMSLSDFILLSLISIFYKPIIQTTKLHYKLR